MSFNPLFIAVSKSVYKHLDSDTSKETGFNTPLLHHTNMIRTNSSDSYEFLLNFPVYAVGFCQ